MSEKSVGETAVFRFSSRDNFACGEFPFSIAIFNIKITVMINVKKNCKMDIIMNNRVIYHKIISVFIRIEFEFTSQWPFKCVFYRVQFRGHFYHLYLLSSFLLIWTTCFYGNIGISCFINKFT